MKIPNNRSQNGFTLVELILSLSIGMVILSAIFSTFFLQQKIFDSQDQKIEALQTARAAINMMTQEVMMAGYKTDTADNLQQEDDTLPTFAGIVYDPLKRELEIRADIDDSGNIVVKHSGTDPDDWKYHKNERVVYKKIGDQIKRKTGGGYFQPFAENIQVFNFQYLKADGTEAIRASDIRDVQILIIAQSRKSGKGNRFKTSRLESVVNLRNMGLY